MKSFSLLLALSLLAAKPGRAAGTASELATLVTRHHAAETALGEAASRQVETARNRYLLSLTAARAEAEKSSRGGTVTAIDAEIAEARTDVHGPAPADLPRALAPARRDFLAALDATEKSRAARQEELRKQYLTDLTRLAQLAATQRDTVLAEAVAKEIAGIGPATAPAGGGGLRHNVVVNGAFSEGELGGLPTGWQPKGASFQGDRIPWQNDAQLIQEGSERFLRFRRAASVRLANVAPTAPIPVPERAKAAVVTARLRVEGLVPGKDYDRFPSVTIRALDANGQSPGGATAAVTENTRWKHVTARLVLQPGAKTLELVAGPSAAAGICDFDDIEVKFE